MTVIALSSLAPIGPIAWAKDINLPERIETNAEREERLERQALEIALSQAIEAEPDDPLNWVNRAEHRLLAGQRSRALTDLGEAIARDDACLPALVLRGKIYSDTRRSQLALADLERVVALRPGASDSLLALAQIHLQMRRWDEAESMIRRVVDSNPQDTTAYLVLGEALRLQLRWSRLEKLARLAEQREIDPSVAHLLRAWAALGTGEAATAEQFATAALAFDPDSAEAIALRAVALAQQDQVHAAENDAQSALTLDPGNGMAYLARAILAERSSNQDAAAAHYLSATNTPRPETLAISYRLEYRLRHEGSRSSEDAYAILADLRLLVDADPENIDLVKQRVRVLDELGQTTAAATDLRRLVKSDPTDQANRIWLARLESNLNRHVNAVRLFESIDPEAITESEDQLALGISLREVGRMDEALDWLTQARDLGTQSGNARARAPYHLAYARALIRAGQTEEALEAYADGSHPRNLVDNRYEYADALRQLSRYPEYLSLLVEIGQAITQQSGRRNDRSVPALILIRPSVFDGVIRSFIALGDMEAAHKQAWRASRLGWQRDAARRQLVAVTRMRGDLDLAYQTIEDAERYLPGDPALLRERRLVAAQSGHLEKALKMVDAAEQDEAAQRAWVTERATLILIDPEDALGQRTAMFHLLCAAAGPDPEGDMASNSPDRITDPAWGPVLRAEAAWQESGDAEAAITAFRNILGSNDAVALDSLPAAIAAARLQQLGAMAPGKTIRLMTD